MKTLYALFPSAHAADGDNALSPPSLTMESTGAATPAPVNMPAAPSAGEAFMMNMAMVALLVVMFYFLLIRPQQKRFSEHSKMLNALKKGDRVVTAGGLIGIIDKISEDSDEAIIDLGGVKVTALRSTIHTKDDPSRRSRAANDARNASKKDTGA